MTIYPPSGPEAGVAAPTALVLVLGGLADGARAEDAADALGAAAPQAAIVAVELDPEKVGALSRVEAALADACALTGLTPSQTILVGRGAAGALALEASLAGPYAICGAIALDPPLEAAWTEARWSPRIRVLQHADADDDSLLALVDVLHDLEVEVRCLQLPPHGRADEAGVLRAVGVFLAELAAYAAATPGAQVEEDKT